MDKVWGKPKDGKTKLGDTKGPLQKRTKDTAASNSTGVKK